MDALPEQFRVSVYYDTEKERKEVYKLLESVNPGHVHAYNGIIDGWATRSTLMKLRTRGLSVVVTGSQPAVQPVAAGTPPTAEEMTSSDAVLDFSAPPPPTATSQPGMARLSASATISGE